MRYLYPNNFKIWFLTASAWQQIFGLHSRLARGNGRSLQAQKLAPPPCHIPKFRSCLGITALVLGLAAASCSRNSDEMTRFHEDGRAKPSVAIASMLDTTSFDASWSLSDELTSGIMNTISNSGEIFVHSQAESPFTENPFGNDLSWMKREFHSEEFVAFLELVEHEFVPVNAKGAPTYESSNNLNMSVRVRVVDLRGPSPKIVLQEMVRDTYFVPKTLIPTDYASTIWGTEEYRKSPMGVAHAGLVQEIAGRISEYILLAKSR